ncbi:histone-lysine N-methyltransferase SETMAR [Trichonephila clavipes]|nr:histone-lysine N-methyltransferase SETMAR [Trichonephila clavipes]
MKNRRKNEQRVRPLLNTDRRLSVRMIAEQLGMDKMVVHKIISEDLGMRKICAKLPRPCSSRLFLLPKEKTALKGRHHGTLDDVKRACTHALKDVSVGDFQGAYEAWKRRLQKCVHAQGAYLEDY